MNLRAVRWPGKAGLWDLATLRLCDLANRSQSPSPKVAQSPSPKVAQSPSPKVAQSPSPKVAQSPCRNVAAERPWRHRWPDDIRDEVLARLLRLNAERAQKERLAGLAATDAAPVKTRKPRAMKPATLGSQANLITPPQQDLFD